MKKNTNKTHFAVCRSVFGDFWVGTTKLPLEKYRVFATFEEAKNHAIDKFYSEHPDFDEDAEDFSDNENAYSNWSNLDSQVEKDLEPCVDKAIV